MSPNFTLCKVHFFGFLVKFCDDNFIGAETLSTSLSWRSSPKSGFGSLKGGANDPGNLSIELSLRYHMSDPCTKSEEDRTKIVVAIVDKRFVQTDRQTDRQTYVHSSDFISVKCHELHWTDKNMHKVNKLYLLYHCKLNNDRTDVKMSLNRLFHQLHVLIS